MSSSNPKTGAPPSCGALATPSAVVVPSFNAKDKALIDRLTSARDAALSAPSPEHAQRQWAEVTVAFDRIVQQRKLSVCSMVSTDACAFFSTLVNELLTYAAQRCGGVVPPGGVAPPNHSWLETDLPPLHEHGLFVLVQHCCDPKLASAMLGEVSSRNLVRDVCTSVASSHLPLFAKIYTTFCDVCKTICTTGTDHTMDARVVAAVRSVMHLVLSMCTGDVGGVVCAALTQQSEPASLISRFLYGIKLRSMHINLFCPTLRELSASNLEATSLVVDLQPEESQREGSTQRITGSSIEAANMTSPEPSSCLDMQSPNPAVPNGGDEATGRGRGGGSPVLSAAHFVPPAPTAHVATSVDYIHAQALEVVVEVVRRSDTPLMECPSCSAVVMNLCSYVSVNVHMAEPESTHEDYLVILFNVQSLLRALQAMIVDAVSIDIRHAVIEEVLKENQGDSVHDLVRMLIVRGQGCAQGDLAVLDALHNFLLIANPPALRGGCATGLRSPDNHNTPMLPLAAEARTDGSPSNHSGTSLRGGSGLHHHHHTAHHQLPGPMVIADKVRSLLGSNFEPFGLLSRSTHLLVAQTPRDPNPVHADPVTNNSSLNSSGAGCLGALVVGSGSSAHVLPNSPEHRLCKATLKAMCYFAKSAHMLPSIRAVACEWIRSFVFGLTATVPVDALPSDVQEDPVAFFLCVAGEEPHSPDGAPATVDRRDRSYLLSCSFHALHSLFHHAHRVPPVQQLNQIAGLVVSPDVLHSSRLLSQGLLVWISALAMVVHRQRNFGASEHDEDSLINEISCHQESEQALSHLLALAANGTLTTQHEGDRPRSVDIPPGECGVDPARWESSMSRSESSWCVDLANTPPAVATSPSAIADGTVAHVSHITAVPSTAVSILELIAKVCSLVLATTAHRTSEDLIRSILGLLDNRTMAIGSGMTTSSPNRGVTSFATFADRCVSSLMQATIPHAMQVYVDTLSNQNLAAVFLPYMLQRFADAKRKSRRVSSVVQGGTSTSPLGHPPSAASSSTAEICAMSRTLRDFAQADGVSVTTSIIADILVDGDDTSLLYQLFQLIGPFMRTTEVLPEFAQDVDRVVRELVKHAKREEAQLALGQTILDAAVGSGMMAGPALHRSSRDSLSEMALGFTRRGPFAVRQPDCAAAHPEFLDLVPPLLAEMDETGHAELRAAFLDALFLVVEATGQIRSDALLDWAISNVYTKFLRHLHIPLAALNAFPFTKSSNEMKRFWTPLLMQAPRRSELRFHGRGGVTVSVESWPEAGLSISCWFSFHEVYPVLPLFEIIGVSDSSMPIDDAVVIEGGETISVNHNAAGATLTHQHPGLGGPGGKKRSILNEDCALAGLQARRWLHFTLVISAARVMTLYFYGRAVGSSGVPSAIVPKSRAEIHLGFVTKQRDKALYSVGETQLWYDELTAPQVLADYCGSDPQRFAAKLLPSDVPREWMLATVSSSSEVNLSSMPMSSRVARFAPHAISSRVPPAAIPGEDEYQLLNLCSYGDASRAVSAQIQHGAIAPPHSFVHFHRLFLSRGGLRYLAQWIDCAQSASEFTNALQLFVESVRVVNMTETMRPRLYALAAYFMRRHIRSFLTTDGALLLIRLAVVSVPENHQMHPVIINRMAFDHLLCDLDLVMDMRQDVAVAYIAELTRMFDTSCNKCARRNFEYVLGFRMFDKILHGCVRIAPAVARAVHFALLELIRKMLFASDFHVEVLSTILHMVAVLTPQTTHMDSQHRPALTISIPTESRVTTIVLPFRLMHFLSVKLLRMVVDVIGTSGGPVAQSVYALVTVPWYLAIVQTPFASTTAVILASRLMADAVPVHAPLAHDFQQHLFVVSSALESHAYDTNVVVFLLAAAVGLHLKINLNEDNKRSILKQLDDVVASSKTDVRPMFSALFAAAFAKHLHLVYDRARLLYREQHCHWPFSSHLSWRTRRYFSAVKVVGIIMLGVHAKRYARRRKTQPGTSEAAGSVVAAPLFTSASAMVSFECVDGTRQLPAPISPSAGSAASAIGVGMWAPLTPSPAGVLPKSPQEQSLSSQCEAPNAFPTFLASTASVPSVTPVDLGVTAPDGDANDIVMLMKVSDVVPGAQLESLGGEPPRLTEASLPFGDRRPTPPVLMTSVEFFQHGHIKPLSELPKYFRRAMTKLLVVIRLLWLPLMHARYDAYNNRRRLRQQVISKEGLFGLAATREIAEPTHFLLSATKTLGAHANMFPVFAGGILQHDLIAFLASTESQPSDQILCVNHIPPVDYLAIPRSSTPLGEGAQPDPAVLQLNVQSSAPQAPQSPLPSESFPSPLSQQDDGGPFAATWTAGSVPGSRSMDVDSDGGSVSGRLGKSLPQHADFDSSSESSEDEDEGHSWTGDGIGISFTVGQQQDTLDRAPSTNDLLESGHYSIQRLFEAASGSPLVRDVGAASQPTQAIPSSSLLRDREAVGAHAREILGVIVRTSLQESDAVKLWGDYAAKAQGSIAKEHLQFLLHRYGACGALLAHCLTSFLGTTHSIKEDSFRITMIFCGALAPVLRDLQEHYNTKAAVDPSTMGLEGGTKPHLTAPQPPPPVSSITGQTSSTTTTTAIPASSSTIASASSASHHHVVVVKQEHGVVKNLVLFVVFLCDRVVTNILSFEAVLPFLLQVLRAVAKSTVEMCPASTEQALAASARKGVDSVHTAAQLICSQVLRVVVITLSRPDPTPTILEHVLVALRACLHREHEPRQLDELLRVLYVAFKTPPVRNYEHVQLLLASIWQFVHHVCGLTPRYKKAVTVKSITQVLSIWRELAAACNGSPQETRAKLDLLFRERREDLDTIFSGRPKAKFDDAVRKEHRMKKDYQEHIPPIAACRKEFRSPHTTAHSLVESYWSLFGSMADALEPVSHINAHWLYFTNNAVHGMPYDEEHYRCVYNRRCNLKPRPSVPDVDTPPALDVVDEISEDDMEELDSTQHPSTTDPQNDSSILGATIGKLKQRHYYDTSRNYVPFQLNVDDVDDDACDTSRSATEAAPIVAARSASIVDASICEEMTSLVSVFCPSFICRCPPIPQRDIQHRMFHDECTTHFTDSARFLLRYLLSPGERVRHICNAFRVDGIHSTPCVVILTDAMLKVYASARITAHGDILIGADDLMDEWDNEEEAGSIASAGSSSSHLSALSHRGGGMTPKGGSPTSTKRLGISTSFRGLERFARRTTQRIQHRVRSIFTGTEKKRIRGSRIARSLHAATHGATSTMRGLCWFYYTNNVTKLQKVQYMHQDCALLVSLAHDNGPLLAIMDDSQSLNNKARDQFFNVAKKILIAQNASNVAYLDESTKSAILEIATERWVHRSCSTYEYVLTLNSIANRVRKDWNQYPVFPWVLTNYNTASSSASGNAAALDLTSPDNFRDFQFPIGAQLEQRREDLRKRYEILADTRRQEMADFESFKADGGVSGGASHQSLLDVIISRVEEVAAAATGGGVVSAATAAAQHQLVHTFPFHHGSHYSSSAGVLHYLIRTEPFTTRAKIYQGGKFDHPDRLFHSIEDTFHSCMHNSADCKELIPEFYSRGQFLQNEDARVFGCRQDGRVVDNVVLPPWAQGSPHVFVAIMRMALECDYVSQRLHRWIDLVFGVRQRGKLAIESFNVFQRFSYGEEVRKALVATQSIQECRAIVAEVENFGQTPVQVFTEAHPARKRVRQAQPPPAAAVEAAGGGSFVAEPSNADGVLLGSSSAMQNVEEASLDSSMVAPADVGTEGGGAAAAHSSIRPTILQALFAHAHRCTLDEDVAAMHATAAPSAASSHQEDGSGRSVSGAAAAAQGGLSGGNHSSGRFILQEPNGIGMASTHHTLASRFAKGNGSGVVSIALQADGRYFADSDQIRLIPETDTCICWYKHEERLLRYRISTGEFHSAVQFDLPEGIEDMQMTAVVVCRREVFLCIGTSSGTIYCLHPDSVRTWCVLGTTLCVHTRPIKLMVASERLSRLVSVTNDPLDPPIVWRVQRLLVAKLHRLPIDAIAPETDCLVSGVAMCPREGNTYLSTRRRVAVFDADGTPWGVGKLPSPADEGSTTLDVYPDITTLHQFLTSDWCDGRVAVLTGHTDGSIGLWCVRRNPPATIAPHAIVTVSFVRLVSPPHQSLGAVTTFRQAQEGSPVMLVGYSSGVIRELRFEESFAAAPVPHSAKRD